MWQSLSKATKWIIGIGAFCLALIFGSRLIRPRPKQSTTPTLAPELIEEQAKNTDTVNSEIRALNETVKPVSKTEPKNMDGLIDDYKNL